MAKVRTLYVGPFTSAWAMNASTIYRPGELGATFEDQQGAEGQLVQLDSGATSATTVGAVAAGQLAYWRDKSAYKVTNKIEDAAGGATGCRGEVAGMFTAAVTAGYYCVVQQKGRGKNAVNVKSCSPAIGDMLVSDNTTATAQGDRVALGTAPTVPVIGRFAAAGTTVTTATVDLDIPSIP